jgi:hypothetical protein
MNRRHMMLSVFGAAAAIGAVLFFVNLRPDTPRSKQERA